MHVLFFFKDTATPEIHPLPLPDALPVGGRGGPAGGPDARGSLMARPLLHGTRPRELLDRLALAAAFALGVLGSVGRSEEHTSELQSRPYLVCRLLLEKKKTNLINTCQLI